MTTYDRCPSLLQESLLLSTYEYIFASPHDRKFGKLCPDEICGMLRQNGVPQESLCYQNYESILAGRESPERRETRQRSREVEETSPNRIIHKQQIIT